MNHLLSSDQTSPALVVFGKPRGYRSPQGGYFTLKFTNRAASIANKTGFTAIQLNGEELRPFNGQLSRGGFDRDRQLRLGAISAKLLNALSAMQRMQARQQRHLAEADAAPGSNGKSTGAQPPSQAPHGGSEPDGNILAAYRLLDHAGSWIQRLSEEFAEIIGRIGKSGDLSVLPEEEWPDEEAYYGGASWVCNDWRWSYPVRYRRQRIGTLALIADIGRSGRPAADLGKALVLVTWSSAVHNWSGTIDAATGFWPPVANKVGLRAQRLFHWIGPSGNGSSEALSLRDTSWFYIVPLRALHAASSHAAGPTRIRIARGGADRKGTCDGA